MKFILVLTIATLLIFLLTIRIWKKTGSVAFVLGIFFLFYWSLAGSWIFFFDALYGFQGKEIGLHYYYFFEKLFKVSLDDNFFMSIILYSLFIIAVQIGILVSYKRKEEKNEDPIVLKVERLLFFMFFFLLVSLGFIVNEIQTAFSENLILYHTVELSSNKYFSLHQVSFQLAITTLLLTVCLLFSKEGRKIKLDKYNSRVFIMVLISYGAIISLLMILGNKKELLFSGMIAILFFIQNNELGRNSLKKSIFIVIIIVVPLLATDIVRAAKFKSSMTLHLKGEKSKKEDKKKRDYNSLGAILFSNELFFANFSMYGVLDKEVPIKPGISLKYLASSVIPSVIKPERPPDVYTYYVNQVNAESGQGYTIHHATAWFLNFGKFGVLIGGMILGLIWGKLSGLHIKGKKIVFTQILTYLVPAITCAYLPVLIRNGLEGYKAFLLEGILLTCLVVFFANKNFKPKRMLWGN